MSSIRSQLILLALAIVVPVAGTLAWFLPADRSLAIGIGVLLLALGLAWRIGAGIVRPIADLVGAAAGVAAGDASARAKVSGPAEVASVARQFNRMLDAREASEAARVESESRFRDFANASGDWFWETDAGHRYTWFSVRLEGKYGRPPAFYTGRTRMEVATAGGADLSAEPWKSHLETLARHEPFRNFVARRATPAGERWLNINGVPRFDAAGRFLGYRAAVTDVTRQVLNERREREVDARLQAVLRESEERFRSLTELSSDWYWEQDRSLRLSFHSAGFERSSGTTSDKLLGKLRWEEPNRIALSATWDEHRATLEARLPFRDFEYVRIGDDGERHYATLSGVPVYDAAGNFNGYRGVGRNITERKQREEELRRFRVAMDATSDSVYIVDRTSLRFLDVNAAACAAQGLARERILALGPAGVLSMTREELARTYDAVIAGGGVAAPTEVLRTRRDGRQVWMELRRHALRSGEGWLIVTVARDITERKQAQAALRESEERYRTLVEWSPEAFVVHRDGKLIYVNPAATKMFGAASEHDLIGRPILDVIHPDFHQDQLARVESIRERVSVTPRVEVRLVKLDGTAIEAEVQGTAIAYNGQPAIHVAMRDVTERKRVEEDLRASRRLMEIMIDAIPMTIFAKDRNSNYVMVNKHMAEFFDTTKEALLQRHTSRLPTSEAERRQALKDDAWVFEHRRTLDKPEVMIEGAGGRQALYHSTKIPLFDDAGELIGLLGINRDISEQKRAAAALARASELLQRTGEVAKVGGWEMDLPTGQLFWSPETCRIHEVDPAVTPAPEKAIEFYAPEARPVIREAVRAAIESGTSWDLELSAITAKGRPFWARVQGGAVMQNGKAVKLFGAFQDITDRREAAAAHALLEAQLRESQKMEAIGTLAGGIAHDFNNILATILGNVELARRDASANPLALESLEEIRKAGSRARDLVQQILSFSRRQPTERKRIALAPIVEESARLLRATLPARIVLDVRCDADVPAVLADATQIQQVLINLATNAMQAMRGAPGRIDMRLDSVMLDAALAKAQPALHALHEKRPGRTARLAVSDDGPGMDAATRERIFEPFFTTKAVDEGTGLGLSVAHGIVQAHEGTIVVESRPGEGATFTLYLPAADARAAPTAAAAPGEGGAQRIPHYVPQDVPQYLPLQILYLDDDESLVFLVTRLLERQGYRVSAHTDQGEALDALIADPAGFDLVVTDYNMPGMSGLDVARKVREIRPDLPVAVASGFIDETLRAQAGGAGVRELIFKADAVEDFCDAMHRVAQAVAQGSKPS